MDSAAPYADSFTPEYRLKIIGGKQTYVPDYSQRPVEPATQRSLPPTGQTRSSGASSERSSAEKRNTWTSHSVLPPIISPRPNEPSPHHANGRSSGYSSNAPSAKSQPLPTEPVQLDKLEEMELLKRIGMSLRYHSMDILKRIYNEVSSTHDQNLTGWAHFTDITFTLEKCQVHIQMEDLKSAASLCVASDKPGYINYERLLSFLASAIKIGNAKKDENPQYFSQSGEKQKSSLEFLSINTRAPRPQDEISGAQGKLIRLIEDQLSQGEVPLDLERLRNQFTLADRLHRDSLSHGEIKEICYRNRVPLQESVINHVLDRCRTTGDGQYRWTDFIDFLERVRPAGSGLNFTSKQPLEYAKVLPEPRDTWPRPDYDGHEPPSTKYKHSPRMPHNDPNTALPQIGSASHPKTARDSGINPIASSDQQHTYQTDSQAYGANVYSASQQPRADGKQMHSDAVQTEQPGRMMSGAAQTTTQVQGDDDESWLDRFGKLAQALYRNDLDKNGHLKPDECRWLITEYNDIYSLQLPKLTIDQSIQLSSNAKGTEIDQLLKNMMLQSAQ